MEAHVFLEDDFHSPTCSSPDMTSGDDLSDSSMNVPASIVNASNYITVKEGCQSAFTTEELNIAINQCKKLVLESEECSEERKWFVRRLIELRHRLQQAKESEEIKTIQVLEESFVKLGHHFKFEYLPTSATKKYCDRCCGTIWNVVQSYYQCTDCQYKCHIKCAESLFRVCAHLVMSENPNYIEKICPEVGLDTQGYRCFECKSRINYNVPKGYYPYLFSDTDVAEARLCNYNGHHYCPSCHWNTPSIIPARVMLNWDFEPQKVCRASYQLIRITKSRPLVTLDENLYSFVDELATIKKKREELGLMKHYIATCRPSLESGLVMRELEWRRHLIHSTTIFSLDDLCDINNGTFLSKIEAVQEILKKHIKEDCTVCRGRGYICELCEKNDDDHDGDDDDGEKVEIIFGFDSNTYTCPKCETVSHKSCWNVKKTCKKCLRREQKLEVE